MNATERRLKRDIMANGIALGAAIASRFMLNFSDSGVAMAVNFGLLFMMFSLMPYWLRGYRQKSRKTELTLKDTIVYTMKVFIVASVVSAVFKYVYFEYWHADRFAEIMGMVMAEVKSMGYPQDLMAETEKMINPGLVAVGSLLQNAILGLPMALVTWPLIKREQEMRNNRYNRL